MMPTRATPFVKTLAHVLCLLPFCWLALIASNGLLPAKADPVKFITHFTGDWAMRILLVDLAISPVRRLHPSLAWMVRLRRMVGLYAFFYATLHLLTYVFLFSGFDLAAAAAGVREGHWIEPLRQLKQVWPTMLDDAKKRPFIQVGLIVWTLLLLLAMTSPQRILRLMGGKNWQRLHWVVYVAAVLAVVHVWWQVRTGGHWPWVSALVLTVLLLARVMHLAMKRQRIAAA
jgi:sulfoxide reductase heme-binding subunit YedZ